VIVPPKGYFERVTEVCRKYDLYMISDEVICGFGRLGTDFGCDLFGFKPSSISVAKALTSAYVPMAAVTVPELMYQALVSESKKIGAFGHGFTYSGHPVAAAVALEVQKIYAEMDIVARAKRLGAVLNVTLGRLAAHPLVGDVRGVGLILGMELMRDRERRIPFDGALNVGARVENAARRRGLIIRVVGDRLVFAPPLVIEASDIEEIGERLGRALDDVAKELEREGA